MTMLNTSCFRKITLICLLRFLSDDKESQSFSDVLRDVGVTGEDADIVYDDFMKLGIING